MSWLDVISLFVACANTVAMVMLAYQQGKLAAVHECLRKKILEGSWRNAEKCAEEDREVSDD